MIYTIEKGTHRSNWIPSFTLKKRLCFTFEFVSDPSYILSNKLDQDDSNKIFGISDSWYHRRHSIRVGWRYDDKLQKAIYNVYYYRDGKHYVEDLGEIIQGKSYLCIIDIHRDSYTVFSLDKQVTVPRTSKWWGPRYLLFPYFGGQQVAPKQFKIEINKY